MAKCSNASDKKFRADKTKALFISENGHTVRDGMRNRLEGMLRRREFKSKRTKSGYPPQLCVGTALTEKGGQSHAETDNRLACRSDLDPFTGN
jgi:hypothetical protein